MNLFRLNFFLVLKYLSEEQIGPVRFLFYFFLIFMEKWSEYYRKNILIFQKKYIFYRWSLSGLPSNGNPQFINGKFFRAKNEKYFKKQVCF